MSPSDSSDLLYKFLFHLRGGLSSIRGAAQMAKHHSEKMSVSVLNWLEKWIPEIEKWVSDEEKAHLFFHDCEKHDWEQILHDMAEKMKDISIACVEVKDLEVPESFEGKYVIEAVMDGSEHLNKLVQSVRSRNYQYLLLH